MSWNADPIQPLVNGFPRPVQHVCLLAHLDVWGFFVSSCRICTFTDTPIKPFLQASLYPSPALQDTNCWFGIVPQLALPEATPSPSSRALMKAPRSTNPRSTLQRCSQVNKGITDTPCSPHTIQVFHPPSSPLLLASYIPTFPVRKPWRTMSQTSKVHDKCPPLLSPYPQPSVPTAAGRPSPAPGKSCLAFPIHPGRSHAQEVCYIFLLISRWDNKAQLWTGDVGIRKGRTGASSKQ